MEELEQQQMTEIADQGAPEGTGQEDFKDDRGTAAPHEPEEIEAGQEMPTGAIPAPARHDGEDELGEGEPSGEGLHQSVADGIQSGELGEGDDGGELDEIEDDSKEAAEPTTRRGGKKKGVEWPPEMVVKVPYAVQEGNVLLLEKEGRLLQRADGKRKERKMTRKMMKKLRLKKFPNVEEEEEEDVEEDVEEEKAEARVPLQRLELVEEKERVEEKLKKKMNRCIASAESPTTVLRL